MWRRFTLSALIDSVLSAPDFQSAIQSVELAKSRFIAAVSSPQFELELLTRLGVPSISCTLEKKTCRHSERLLWTKSSANKKFGWMARWNGLCISYNSWFESAGVCKSCFLGVSYWERCTDLYCKAATKLKEDGWCWRDMSFLYDSEQCRKAIQSHLGKYPYNGGVFLPGDQLLQHYWHHYRELADPGLPFRWKYHYRDLADCTRCSCIFEHFVALANVWSIPFDFLGRDSPNSLSLDSCYYCNVESQCT